MLGLLGLGIIDAKNMKKMTTKILAVTPPNGPLCIFTLTWVQGTDMCKLDGQSKFSKTKMSP